MLFLRSFPIVHFITILLLFLNQLSCSHPPSKSKPIDSPEEIERQSRKKIYLPNFNQQQIQQKILKFEKALYEHGKNLNQVDWGLHDELLQTYIQLKNQSIQGTRIQIPAHSRLQASFSSFCLNSNRAPPEEEELYEWVKNDPGIPYYKELIEKSSLQKIHQDDLQELLWNLQNRTYWENYPEHLKIILRKIDPNAPVKLPSKIKKAIKDTVVDYVKAQAPILQDIEDTVAFIEGEYYQYKDFAKSIEKLTSKYPLEVKSGFSQIPDTQVYTSHESISYGLQEITFYNPTDQNQEIDLLDYYLQPQRKDVQRIGVSGYPAQTNPELLAHLEKVLYETMARVGIGFTPILGDAADLYELIQGKDFLNDSILSFDERLVSAVGLILGSGATYRYIKRWAHAPTEYLPKFESELYRVAKKESKTIDYSHVQKAFEESQNKAHQFKQVLDYTGVQQLSNFLRNKSVERRVRNETIQSFEIKSIHRRTLDENELVYRWHNDDQQAKQIGHYVTPDRINDTNFARQMLALPPENQMKYLDALTLKKGTPVFEGKIAPNFGHSGGGRQYLIMDRPENALKFKERIK